MAWDDLRIYLQKHMAGRVGTNLHLSKITHQNMETGLESAPEWKWGVSRVLLHGPEQATLLDRTEVQRHLHSKDNPLDLWLEVKGEGMLRLTSGFLEGMVGCTEVFFTDLGNWREGRRQSTRLSPQFWALRSVLCLLCPALESPIPKCTARSSLPSGPPAGHHVHFNYSLFPAQNMTVASQMYSSNISPKPHSMSHLNASKPLSYSTTSIIFCPASQDRNQGILWIFTFLPFFCSFNFQAITNSSNLFCSSPLSICLLFSAPSAHKECRW